MKHNHYSVTKVEDLTVLWEISLFNYFVRDYSDEEQIDALANDEERDEIKWSWIIFTFFITMKVKDRIANHSMKSSIILMA